MNAPNILRNLNKQPQEMSPKILRTWRENPNIFAKDALDIQLDDWQIEANELYQTHQRLAFLASKGAGKTYILSFMAWHFFTCHHYPKIGLISISMDHLLSNLWAEIQRMRAHSELLTKISKSGARRIALVGHEQYSFMDCRAFPKQADIHEQASTLAGLHADNVCFIADEAGKIPDSVLVTADAALTTGDGPRKKARLICAGNPEVPSGMVYRAVKGRTNQKWGVVRVNGDPENPKRAPRVSITWAQEAIDSSPAGRDDPWIQINVLGQYPPVSSDFLLTEDVVLKAMEKNIKDEDISESQIRGGLDVSRGGEDYSILTIRQGLKQTAIYEFPSTMNGSELASKVAYHCHKSEVERLFVDDTGGYGASVIDFLAVNYSDVDVTPVKFNALAQERKRFFNTRSEMWLRMKSWIEKGGVPFYDKKLVEELCSARMHFTGSVGRLEEKRQIKALIGRSPDRADALALTFHDEEQPRSQSRNQGQGGYQAGEDFSDDSWLDESFDGEARKTKGNYLS